MKTLVIFDSQFGNTERLAEVIARRLGADAPLWAADGAAKAALERRDWDLLIIGAPTQNHTVSPTMRALLQGVPYGALKDAHVAVFDTRYRMARFLTGQRQTGSPRVWPSLALRWLSRRKASLSSGIRHHRASSDGTTTSDSKPARKSERRHGRTLSERRRRRRHRV